MGGLEVFEHARQHAIVGERDKSNRETSPLTGSHLLHLEHRGFQEAHYLFGVPEKGDTFIGEFDMPACSAEQLHANAALQILNRSRKGRLGNANRRGGLTEVKPLSDSNEMPQLAQLWRADTHIASIRVQ
jgi:hypothetical protein